MLSRYHWMDLECKIGKRKLLFCLTFVLSIQALFAQTQRQNLEATVIEDSICNFKTTLHQPVIGQFILPISLFGAGFMVSGDNDLVDKYELREERNERLNGFHTKVDDYLQFAPLVAGYGMLAMGARKNSWHYTRQIALTEFILGVSVTGIKTWTNVLRPDGGSKNSFPSGHTAQAFASATLFSDYFAPDHPWLRAAAYLTATGVGVLRVMNNRHWVPDVIAGAGVGIISAKLSAFVFEKRCNRKHLEKRFDYSVFY